MTGADPEAADPSDPQDVRAVLRIAPFRRLWVALSLSSLGDWLGLLATTALAAQLADGFSAQNYAIGGVLFVRLLPAILLGPLAGAFADRFSRRWTMVLADLVRFALYVSIPLVGSLTWLIVASFLIEAVSLFWIPAKEASVPNLVPPERLEAANQLSLLTTYGSAPVAALVFFLLSGLNGVLATGFPFFRTNSVDLALYFNALTFLISAGTIARLDGLGRRAPDGAGGHAAAPGLFRSIVDGWKFVGRTPLVRGLVTGLLGAFAAGGAVIALGRSYVAKPPLEGGNAAYGVLFGAIFVGLALGMFLGPRLLHDFSRPRLAGVSMVGAGMSLCVVAILPSFFLALVFTVLLGAFAGVAWVVGYTLLGREVDDAVRGRTFAFVQSVVRVDLLVVLAVAPLAAGLIGEHSVQVRTVEVPLDGVMVVLFVGGLLAVATGVVAYRQMDDRPGVPLWTELRASLRPLPQPRRMDHGGLFVAFEGGDGAGKSTQARMLEEWLAGLGHPVVVTREPGATPVGRRLREVLLDPETGALSPRAETLLYAADRAEHVDTVIRPALDRGNVVITDRYIDSSLAYQGAGRALAADEVARISRWATGGLRPDLTVLLDIDPAVGLARSAEPADRMESEPGQFHQRVRQGFLNLAARDSAAYLVSDASRPPAEVHAEVRARLEPMLPRLRGPRRAAVPQPAPLVEAAIPSTGSRADG